MKYIDIREITEKDYRQKQLDNAIFKQLAKSLDEIQTLPKDLRGKLKEKFTFPLLEPIKEFTTPSTLKILFKSKRDQKIFESVLLKHKDKRRTVCVSTQIGCPMSCTFCATGKMGFTRDLSYREIVDQILFFQRHLAQMEEHITNIVYMGMGEPFLNPENTTKSISIINDEKQFNLGARSITISTVGIIEPMKKFFAEFPQVNLAVSLHSAKQEIREQIMPQASKVSLNELGEYIKFHINEYNRRVSLEYLLLESINDQESDIEALIKFIETLGNNAGKLIHVNLIPYNEIASSKLSPTPKQKVISFRDTLLQSHIKTTIRKSLGQETEAACGMLKTQNLH
jgi:23S rRNA (adenine2503-C2)-methyltransferase